MPRLGGRGGPGPENGLVAAPLEEESRERLVWEMHPESRIVTVGRRKKRFSDLFSGTCVGAVQEGLIAQGLQRKCQTKLGPENA
jgi:hypothetical protein